MQEIILSIYAIVAFIVALIIVKANRRNNNLGTKIQRMMGAVFCLIIFYTINFMTENQLIMKIGNSLSLFMLDLLVLFFLDYVLEFLDWQEKFPIPLRWFLYVLVALDGAFLLSNPFNNEAFDYVEVVLENKVILGYLPKTAFHSHFILVIAIVSIAILLLILKFIYMPRVYWKRFYCIWLGLLIAVVTNCIYFSEIYRLRIDFSVLAYGLFGILLYFNTFIYQGVVNKAITRGIILDYLSEPVILFDYEGVLADYTVNMKDLIPEMLLKKRDAEDGKPLTRGKFLEYTGIKEVTGLSEDKEFEYELKTEQGKKIYQCRYSCMKDKGRIIGSSFVFYDITTVKEAYFALERSITYDKLTGFFNKRSFFNQMPQWEDSKYWPVTIAVFNVNNLQMMNDSYGTEYGDQVMLALTSILKGCIGTENFIAKVDGGDIVAVFENMSQEKAIEVCEKIKKKMETVSLDNPVTLEYGVSEKADGAKAADKVFLEARNSMRNKKMLLNTSASRALVDSLKQTLSESDYETEEHVERTREMSARLGKEMGLSDSDIAKLELLAVLHDIGKVAIPHNVLVKKGKLNEEERKIMQQHTVKGYRIAKSSPELAEIADCILSHHEKWDGTGYPNGLKGEEIPLLARVISAVDSHDVMVHNRPYHTAMPEQAAIDELKACAGTQFDPHVVEVFVGLLEREELNKELQENEDK
ncbi:MAG: HD domain-containing protein [Roseburia sp.]|nr:HD domain-containing protein [Roseburia sp.]MCM1279040.1 HD domain-containing protein [Robinsoniella sp.]